MRSQHNFSQTPSVSVPRSTFNLSHGHKTCFEADDLVPICQPIDIIPGDTFRVNTNFFMRLATPLAPILDNLYFETFAFFVAYRTIWENHENFMVPRINLATLSRSQYPFSSVTPPVYTRT